MYKLFFHFNLKSISNTFLYCWFLKLLLKHTLFTFIPNFILLTFKFLIFYLFVISYQFVHFLLKMANTNFLSFLRKKRKLIKLNNNSQITSSSLLLFSSLLSWGLLFWCLSFSLSSSTSSSSWSVISSLSSDSSAFIFDNVFVLSLFVLSKE